MQPVSSSQSLFDARQERAFGCVFFDLESRDGQAAEPVLGKGWMSIEGQQAQRFADPKQLDPDVRWLTNLDKKQFWISGAVRNKSLRHSGYLRLDVGQIMKEAGLLVKELTVAGVCERMSELHARVSRLARTHYGILEFQEAELREQLGRALAIDDQPISMEIDEALRRCWQEVVSLSAPGSEPKKAMIFRRPRLEHARAILQTQVPVGGWEFIDAKSMPPEGARLDWLFAKDRPFVAKVRIGHVFEESASQKAASLLSFADPLATGARRRERDWMCSNELFFWAQRARIEPLAVFMAQGSQLPQESPGLLEMGPLSGHSLSLGIMAECHWMAMASRARPVQARMHALVSPRAAFLRAADRFFCFDAALKMQLSGFEPVSYGLGSVAIAFKSGAQFRELGDALKRAGLLAPAGLFEALKHKADTRTDTLSERAREQLEGRLEGAREAAQ